MRSFVSNRRYPSAQSRSAGLALVLLGLVSACGGAAAPASPQGRPASLLTSAAATPPSLGAAASFAVLAGTAVACTDSTIAGDVGVYPGIAIAQTNCPVTGTINPGNAAAAQAARDFAAAYVAFNALPCTTTLTTLDGQRLSPGVYCFDAAATSTGGVLTLDGPANGSWIFKVGTLGTGALTGTNFTVVTPSGAAPACGSVYWWVAEAVTMTNSKFVGTVLAGRAVTITGGTFSGNAYAKAAVTFTGTAANGCALGSGGGAPPPVCGGEGDDDHADEDGNKACDDGEDHHDGDDHHDGRDDHHEGRDDHRNGRHSDQGD